MKTKTWTVTIRYRTGLGRPRFLRDFKQLMALYGFRLVDAGRYVFHGISEEDLAAAATKLFDSAALEALEKEGLLPLSAARRRTLSNKLAVNSYTFASKSEGVSLKLELAKSNEYPAIGAWVWYERKLTLFGGFLVVTSRDHDKINWWVKAVKGLPSVGKTPKTTTPRGNFRSWSSRESAK
ncbi:MAG: hypothetical protein JWP03_1546 [Phycisphaerales bacterium]|nr:hypothetical protein [Phycisphaerales bacterium]